MSASPKTETVRISDVKPGFSALVERVSRRETRVLIEKNGAPVAALVFARDLQRLEQLDRERADRFKILDEVGVAFADVPFEELEREIARSLAEVRAARKKEKQSVGVEA